MQKHTLRCSLIFAALVASSPTFAKSNQPIPRPSEIKQPPEEKSEKPAPPHDDQRQHALEPPAIIENTPAQQTQKEPVNDAKKTDDKASADWWMVWLTGVLAFIAFLQLIVFGLQARRLRQSIIKMDEIAAGQTKDMADTIKESGRSATAMEGVMKGIEKTVATNENVLETQRDFWSRQIRAYISVDTGGYFRQNRRTNIKFEFRPNIMNNGATPANFVKAFARCDIKTINIPIDFDFSINNDPHNAPGSATIFSRVSKFKSAVLERFATRQELAGLIKGKLIFHVWGTVFYKDIFGANRFSNFSFVIFMPNNKRGNPVWQTTERHNDAN
jgi:hypothetical protein